MVKDHIAIILARGGSKRLPNKNILDFYSKPMIAWTIDAAINSGQFFKVIVSTDNQEIANIGIKYGAEVPFLRASGADDVTSSSEATIIALKQATDYYGIRFRYVSQLMANCPLRDEKVIEASLDKFYNDSVESQISCFKYGFMNPWWALKKDTNGTYKKLFVDAHQQRSQDLPDLYCPTGAIWTAKTDALKRNKSFYTDNHTYFEISWKAGLDIDDQDDFDFAVATKISEELKNNKKI